MRTRDVESGRCVGVVTAQHGRVYRLSLRKLQYEGARGRRSLRTGGAASDGRQGLQRAVHVSREGAQPDGDGIRLVLRHVNQHRPSFVSGPPQNELIAAGPNACDEQD